MGKKKEFKNAIEAADSIYIKLGRIHLQITRDQAEALKHALSEFEWLLDEDEDLVLYDRETAYPPRD